MKEYLIRDDSINVIGKQGEHGVRTFLFPVTEWEQEFPDGTFLLLVTRPTEKEGIPVVTTVSDGYLRWVVGIVETELAGTGSCEFMVMEDGDVAKSITYQIKVIESNNVSEEPPEPYQPYIEKVAEYAQSASDSADRAEQAASTINATVEREGAGVTITVIDADGEVHTASVYDGESPSVGVDTIEGGHRVTITDHAHPQGQPFDVMDGEKGDRGDDGYSPAVTIEDIENGHSVTITDRKHPSGQTFDVENGYSPVVTIAAMTDGHTVTITDEDHPSGQTFEVMDGVSPEVTVTEIHNGHQVKITDKTHPSGHTFDVLNGVPQDVRINGTSIVDEDGIADIPVATASGAIGVVGVRADRGITMSGTNVVIAPANETDIENRVDYKPIVPRYLPTAVKSAMSAPVSTTDPAWTDSEKLAAQTRIGINMGSKVDEPAEEGTKGQFLTTDGDGGRTWSTVNGVEVTSGTPVNESTQVVIDPSQTDEFSLPQIDDEHTSDYDTWSSNKISEEIGGLGDSKVDKIEGKGLSANDFTDTLKTKLDGIEANATHTIVDEELSDESTNPVQNKVVSEALDDVNQTIAQMPTEATGELLLREEELKSEYFDKFAEIVSDVIDRLPKEDTMSRLIAAVFQSAGLLEDLYKGIDGESEVVF